MNDVTQNRFYQAVCFLLALSMCVLPIRSEASTVDSIRYYLSIQDELPIDQLNDKLIQLTNQIFNSHTNPEIDSISQQLDQIKDDFTDLKSKTILHQVRCAYLSNASQYAKAQACEEEVMQWAIESGRKDVKLMALEDLNFIYNHLGRYGAQIDVLHEAIQLSFELDLPVDRIYYYAWMGEARSYVAAYDSAYHYLTLAEELAIQEQDSALLTNVYERQARVALEQGNYPYSYERSMQAVDMAREHDLRIRETTNLIYAAYSAYYLGDYESAIDYELQALDIYDHSEDANTASIYNRLGKIYNNLHNYDVAQQYLDKAWTIHTKNEYALGQAKVALNLIDTYIGMDDLIRAQEYVDIAIDEFAKIDDPANLSESYMKLSKLERALSHCELSSQYMTTAISTLRATDQYADLGRAHLQAARLYSQCDLSISEPSYHAQQAYDLSMRTGDLHTKMEAAKIIADIAESRDQLDVAYLYQKEYSTTYQQIYNQKNQAALSREQARFAVQIADEKRKSAEWQNQLLTTRNRTQRLMIWGSLLFAMILGALLYRVYRSGQQLKTQNTLIDQQNQELASLNTLKNRLFGIISHDLRTPISALLTIPQQISLSLRANDIKSANEKVQDLGHRTRSINTLLNNLLQWSLVQMDKKTVRPKLIPIEDELLDCIDLYESIAASKNIEIDVSSSEAHQAWGDIDAFQTICRNLISNAIKYSPKGGQIYIKSTALDEHIEISISDQGVGMTQKQIDQMLNKNQVSTIGTAGEKGTGLGLLVVKDLVAINKGQLLLSDNEPGLIVTFTLPKYGSVSS